MYQKFANIYYKLNIINEIKQQTCSILTASPRILLEFAQIKRDASGAQTYEATPLQTSMSVISCHLFMATNHLSSRRRQLLAYRQPYRVDISDFHTLHQPPASPFRPSTRWIVNDRGKTWRREKDKKSQ